MNKKQSSLHSLCILSLPAFMPCELKVFQLQKIETDASLYKPKKEKTYYLVEGYWNITWQLKYRTLSLKEEQGLGSSRECSSSKCL